MPVDGPQDNWNHARFAGVMAFQRARHLGVVAIIGCQEVRADQQKDDVNSVETLIDHPLPLLSRADSPVVLTRNCALAFQETEMFFQVIAQHFITVRVREENFDQMPQISY